MALATQWMGKMELSSRKFLPFHLEFCTSSSEYRSEAHMLQSPNRQAKVNQHKD